MQTKVYKVVLRRDDNKLYSGALLSKSIRINYKTIKWNYPNPKCLELGFGILCFEYSNMGLDSAKCFLARESRLIGTNTTFRALEIYEAYADNVKQVDIPNIGGVFEYDNDGLDNILERMEVYKNDQAYGWPYGTLICNKIRLIKKIYTTQMLVNDLNEMERIRKINQKLS